MRDPRREDIPGPYQDPALDGTPTSPRRARGIVTETGAGDSGGGSGAGSPGGTEGADSGGGGSAEAETSPGSRGDDSAKKRARIEDVEGPAEGKLSEGKPRAQVTFGEPPAIAPPSLRADDDRLDRAHRRRVEEPHDDDASARGRARGARRGSLHRRYAFGGFIPSVREDRDPPKPVAAAAAIPEGMRDVRGRVARTGFRPRAVFVCPRGARVAGRLGRVARSRVGGGAFLEA